MQYLKKKVEEGKKQRNKEARRTRPLFLLAGASKKSGL
jgi:hypothetical protein